MSYESQLEAQNEELQKQLAEFEREVQKYRPKVRKTHVLPHSDGNIGLVQKLSSLPGINVTGVSCSEKFSIWFHAIPSHDNVGLFIIARCTDSRYWKHGSDWHLFLGAADYWEDGVLPITYQLECRLCLKTAIKQAQDLVTNIDIHLNHVNFLKTYGITQERLKEEI